MTFAARLDRIIGDAVAELGLSTPQRPMSAECHRLVDAIRRKAREPDVLTSHERGLADLTIVRGEDIDIDR